MLKSSHVLVLGALVISRPWNHIFLENFKNFFEYNPVAIVYHFLSILCDTLFQRLEAWNIDFFHKKNIFLENCKNFFEYIPVAIVYHFLSILCDTLFQRLEAWNIDFFHKKRFLLYRELLILFPCRCEKRHYAFNVIIACVLGREWRFWHDFYPRQMIVGDYRQGDAYRPA